MFTFTPQTANAELYFFEIIKIKLQDSGTEKKVEIIENQKPENALQKILSSLGISQPKNVVNNNPSNFPQLNNSPLGQIISNPSFPSQKNNQMGGAGQLFGNQGLGGFVQKVFSGQGGPERAVAGLESSSIFGGLIKRNNPQDLSKPYSGPGGSTSGDCDIPNGPVAFNIGGENGNGVSCNAQTVFVGFKQNLKSGVFGGGYVNPMLEKGMDKPGASVGNCKNPQTAQEYDEKCFTDYASGEARAYVQEQLIHWQNEGGRVGQKCVPVYLDNCDSIGSKNYKTILDSIELLNNSGQVKLKVINPNPQISACNFLSHPAVVGALAELDENNGYDTVRRVSAMRNNSEQILIVTRGGRGTDANLREASTANISNVSYSFDVTGNSSSEYKKIYNCTYK